MIERLRHYMLVRHRRNWELFFKFCIVGGSGFVVNLVVYKASQLTIGSGFETIVVDLPSTDYNVRVYHVCSTSAFLVANFNNYLLNRFWTFSSGGYQRWMREYVPFLAIGLIAQAMVLAILTLLLHDNSPIQIHNAVLAQAIAIVVVTPVSFAGNKVWTFSSVRERDRSMYQQ